jgi:hypothetical protein
LNWQQRPIFFQAELFDVLKRFFFKSFASSRMLERKNANMTASACSPVMTEFQT